MVSSGLVGQIEFVQICQNMATPRAGAGEDTDGLLLDSGIVCRMDSMTMHPTSQSPLESYVQDGC